MKTQVLGLLLSLSVLFNIFFAVGYMRARTQLAQEDPADRVPRLVTDELNLDEAQAEVFRSLRSGMEDEKDVYREGIAMLRQEILAELNGREPDIEKLRVLSDREAELHRQRHLAGSQRFQEFITMLEPEQRDRLSRRFRGGRPRHRGPGPEMMKRFDVNGDGEIDETEREAIVEFMRQSRMEQAQRWRERAAKYDVNGDGELDADEHRAMRKARHEEFGRGRDGRDGRDGRPGRGGRRGRPDDRGGDRRGEPPGG